MKKVYSVLGIILLAIIVWGGYNYSQKNEEQVEEISKQVDNSQEFSDAELYEIDPNLLFNGYNGEKNSKTSAILDELTKRSLNKDLKSFERLIILFHNTRYVYSRDIIDSFYEIFEKEPDFFFKNTYKNQYRDSVYDGIIVKMGTFIDTDKLTSFGEYSKDFIDRYNYFQKHPENN